MALRIEFTEYKKQKDKLILNCECGWEGKAESKYMELHQSVMDLSCPSCDKMLLIINLIKDATKFKNYQSET